MSDAVLSAAERDEIELVDSIIISNSEFAVSTELLLISAFNPRGMALAAAEDLVTKLGIVEEMGYSSFARRYAVDAFRAGIDEAYKTFAESFGVRLAVESAQRLATMQILLEDLHRSKVESAEYLALAARLFEVERPDATPIQSLDFIIGIAQNYKALTAEVAEFRAPDQKSTEFKAEAFERLKDSDPIGAAQALSKAKEAIVAGRFADDIRELADLSRWEAEAYLFAGNAVAAANSFNQAGKYLEVLFPAEAARVRFDGGTRMLQFSLQMGYTFQMMAVDLAKAALAYWNVRDFPEEYADVALIAANALRSFGARFAKLDVLLEAETLIKSAIRVASSDKNPIGYAALLNAHADTLEDMAQILGRKLGTTSLEESYNRSIEAIGYLSGGEKRFAEEEFARRINNFALWLVPEQAVRLFRQAVKILRTGLMHYDPSSDDWAGIANNLAISYLRLGDTLADGQYRLRMYHTSLIYLRRSLAAFEGSNRVWQVAQCCSNIGLLYVRCHSITGLYIDLSSALNYLNRAIELYVPSQFPASTKDVHEQRKRALDLVARVRWVDTPRVTY